MRQRMLRQIHYHYQDRGPNYTANMEIDLTRFERQFSLAQYRLDSTVMTDMVPYMPTVTGTFINVTRAMSASIAGTGKVYAAAPPFGRFLYKGKTMVGQSGSTYAMYGEKKVLVSQFRGRTNAKPNLTYNTQAHPEAQARWFKAAKEAHKDEWERLVRSVAGGG